VVEPPAPATLQPQHVPEQRPGRIALEEHVLRRCTFVAESRRDRDRFHAEPRHLVEEGRDTLCRFSGEQRAVHGDAEPALERQLDRIDGTVIDAVLAYRGIVPLAIAVQVDREGEVGRRLVIVDALAKQERVRAQVDEPPARDDATNDLRHVLVQQRLAPGDRDDRSTAFIDCRETLLDRKPAIEDVLRILDLPTTGAFEIAAEERLEHEHQRIPLDAEKLLPDDVRADLELLSEGYAHWRASFPPSVRAPPLRQLGGHREDDALRVAGKLADVAKAVSGEAGQHFAHECLWSRGARGDADAHAWVKPIRVDFTRILDEPRPDPDALADLAQPVRIRAVACSDHEEEVDLAGQLTYGVLAVLCGVADIVTSRHRGAGKTQVERGHEVSRLVHRQRRLRDNGHMVGIAYSKARDVFQGFDEMNVSAIASIIPSQRSYHFRMPAMPHHDNVTAGTRVPNDFKMDSGH